MERYQLKEGFMVEKADAKEFALYHSIYLHGKYNMWFPTSMERSRFMFESVKSSHWILKDNQRVGGLLLKPNRFGYLFLIPPYNDEWKLLVNLLPLLISWSDLSQPIYADSVNPQSYNYYKRLGFQAAESEKCMIRPTETFEVHWDHDVYFDIPNVENMKDIATLFYEVFSHSSLPLIANRNLDYYNSLLEDFFEAESNVSISNQCSTLIYDKESNELIGACTVGFWEELPQIHDIVVSLKYQGRGFGTKMLKRALNNAKAEFPAVRLWVNPGNSSETLYYNMGFCDGVEITNFIRLAKS